MPCSRVNFTFTFTIYSRYVDHLANCLKQKMDIADKMVASQEAVRQRSLEAVEEANKLQPKLELIIAKTKELQGEVRCDCMVIHSDYGLVDCDTL
jgi:hypothetical protein